MVLQDPQLIDDHNLEYPPLTNRKDLQKNANYLIWRFERYDDVNQSIKEQEILELSEKQESLL